MIVSSRSQIHRSSRITTETTFFRKIFVENIRNVDPGDENRHIVIRPTSNLPFNKSNCVVSFPIASNRSQIHTRIRKTITNVFSLRIMGEIYPKYGSGRRKLTYCDTTDFQPTTQQVIFGLDAFSLLPIHQNYIDQVGRLSRRCFP